MQTSGFSRPTLSQLIDTIRGDLLTRFNEDSVLRRFDAEIYSRVQALPFTPCTAIARRLNFDYKVCYELYN